MKKILLIMLLLIVGCSKEPINYETTLVERDGVTFTKDTNKPYSGKWTSWYDNGQKKAEVTYKDGKLISQNCWDKNGNECECSENWLYGCK